MMRARKQLPSAPTVVEVAKDMQAAVWAEVSTRLLRGLRALLEGLLEPEVTSHVGPGRYERTTTRRGHRNGHYSRNLLTTHGSLSRLRVPRLLAGSVDFTLFDKYQRRYPAARSASGGSRRRKR